MKIKERKTELGYNLNYYSQPSLNSSSTIELYIVWLFFQGGFVSCNWRLLICSYDSCTGRLHSYDPEDIAANPVTNSDAYGPVRNSLVTWSQCSFRSSHLLLLLFLKPPKELLTVLLPSLLTHLNLSEQLTFELPRKENLTGCLIHSIDCLIESLKSIKCFLSVCFFWHNFMPHSNSFHLSNACIFFKLQVKPIWKGYLRLWDRVKYLSHLCSKGT